MTQKIDAIMHKTDGSIGRKVLKIHCLHHDCLIPLPGCHPTYCTKNRGHAVWFEDGKWKGKVICGYEKE